jgi:hypothetical protein
MWNQGRSSSSSYEQCQLTQNDSVSATAQRPLPGLPDRSFAVGVSSHMVKDDWFLSLINVPPAASCDRSQGTLARKTDLGLCSSDNPRRKGRIPEVGITVFSFVLDAVFVDLSVPKRKPHKRLMIPLLTPSRPKPHHGFMGLPPSAPRVFFDRSAKSPRRLQLPSISSAEMDWEYRQTGQM